MLRLFNTTSMFGKFSNKKCAEVFCQAMDSFSIVCTFCEMKSFAFEDFLMHFKNVHLDCIETPPNPFKVKEEEEASDFHDELSSFNEEADYIPHEAKVISSSEALSPSALTSFRDSYLDHANSDSDEDSKGTAKIKDDSEDEEYIPKIFNSVSKKVSDVKHKCSECSRSYKLKKTLEYHVSTYHNKNNKFGCSRCKHSFDTECNLDLHMKTKHAEFQCDQCHKLYKTRTILKFHKLTHTDERNFICDVENCGKAFYTLKVLNRHIKISHIMENNIICELCGYRTKTKHHLAVHYRSHTGEKPFACKDCDRRFASSSLLIEHKAMHLTTKPHVCSVCGASFARPKTLYHHKHLHLGIKKFVCKICGKAYAQASGLCGHMKQHKEEQF